MLPVLDDCERALQVLRDSDADKAAIEGTELIYNKLMAYLKGRGLSVIEALGKDWIRLPGGCCTVARTGEKTEKQNSGCHPARLQAERQSNTFCKSSSGGVGNGR